VTFAMQSVMFIYTRWCKIRLGKQASIRRLSCRQTGRRSAQSTVAFMALRRRARSINRLYARPI